MRMIFTSPTLKHVPKHIKLEENVNEEELEQPLVCPKYIYS